MKTSVITPAVTAAALSPLPTSLVQTVVAQALAEDLGLAGDITSEATVPENAVAAAMLRARKPGIVAGLAFAEEAFRQVDPRIVFQSVAKDGDHVGAGGTIARISGPARGILGAERVALNFLGRMSGIATLARRYVDSVAGTGATIVDTRKTTPGLRAIEKYAVRTGGGQNHRFGLFDAVMIKDNHIVAAGGIPEALRAVRARVGHMVKIEIEVDALEQLPEVLDHAVDVILLDNMPPATLRKAVQLIAGRAITEASGGVTLENVREIAETGVDLISVGALTHSAHVHDIGLDFEPADDPGAKP